MNSEIKYLNEMVISLFMVLIYISVKLSIVQANYNHLSELVFSQNTLILQVSKIQSQDFEMIQGLIKNQNIIVKNIIVKKD